MTVAQFNSPHSGALNMVQPINWLAPLNKGLIANWRCMPGLMSGSQLVNLTRPAFIPGTLTNGAAWSFAKGRPSILFDGSNDVLRFTYNGRPLTEFSVFATVYLNSLTDYNPVFCIGTGGDRMAYLDTRITTGLVNVGFTQGHNTHKELSSANAVAAGAWYRIGGTYKSGELSVYINGLRDATTSSFTGNPDNAETFGSIGALYNDAEAAITNALEGYIQDIRFSNRAFSQWEGWHDYQQSLKHWPDELNWFSPRAYVELAAARHLCLLGVGI